jgi:hypothetical protein
MPEDDDDEEQRNDIDIVVTNKNSEISLLVDKFILILLNVDNVKYW